MRKISYLSIVFVVAVCNVYAQDAKNLFESWDMNKDGVLVFKEFPGDRSYFNEIDSNRDQKISLREFEHYMAHGRPAPIEKDPPPPDNKAGVQNQIKELQQQNQNLQAENAGLKNQINQLQQSNVALQQKNAQLEGQIQELTRKNKQLSDLLAGMKGEQPLDPPPPVEPPKDVIPPPQISQPSSKPAQNWLEAEEIGRLDAMRNLATTIRGAWIASCSSDIDGQNRLLVVSQLDYTQLVGVQQAGEPDVDFVNEIVYVKMEINRANIIESIRRANPSMTAEDYQELRFMFPEKVDAHGKGAWSQVAQKRILAYHGAQMDARRKLVEQLRGVIIKSSTRMENFVVTSHVVVASIENTLLIGVKVVDEKIIQNSVAQATIEISRPMFIYSIRRGLEAHGEKLTPDEYQNLRNMLAETTYQFTGKSAIK